MEAYEAVEKLYDLLVAAQDSEDFSELMDEIQENASEYRNALQAALEVLGDA